MVLIVEDRDREDQARGRMRKVEVRGEMPKKDDQRRVEKRLRGLVVGASVLAHQRIDP